MSTPVTSTFDGLASVDRYGNLAPIVVDRLDERYPNSAQTGERIAAVEASVGQRVHVGDTYVGVTQQPGATMKDKLHAACAEASSTGALVMLPSTPIDVGAGFSMAGYSCGIIGQPVGVRKPVSTPAFIEGSGLVASQQAGPVLDLRGFKWRNAYQGRVPFRDFHLRGDDVVDATRTNVGLYIAPGYSPDGKHRSFHAGAGLIDFDLVISGCGGGGIYANQFYFTRSRFDIAAGIGTGAADVPAAIFENATGADVKLNLFSPSSDGTQVVGPSGLVRVTDWTRPTGGEPIRSNVSRWDVSVENFHMTSGSTLVHLQACANEVQMTLQDIIAVKDAAVTETSAVRIVKPSAEAGLSNGANLVHGFIYGNNEPLAFTHPVWLQDDGNAVVGSRGFGTHNVVIDPGVTGSYINLQGAYGKPTTPGVVDNSGKPGKNTILDYAFWPETGRTPVPRTTTDDTVTRNTTSPSTDAAQLQARPLQPGSRYRFTAQVDYTGPAGSGAAARFGVQQSSNITVESWHIDGIPYGATDRTVVRTSGTGNGDTSLACTGNRETVTITGTVSASSAATATSYFRVWWAKRTSSMAPFVIHAGALMTLEKIA